MITPKSLNKGDKIAIVAPAGKIIKEIVDNAGRVFESWGLKVVLGNHLFNNNFQYAADDKERASDFQQMLNDGSIKAIMCARGGYGALRIIDSLNFSSFIKNPKWIIGFSDITVFHSFIQRNYSIETIHATMTAGFPDDGKSTLSIGSLRKVLFRESLNYDIETHLLSRKGKSEGFLTGGNLAILCSLIGSNSDIDTSGKILFIEDVGEYLYRLDRMMWTLKRAGKLQKLAGLIVGGMTDMKDNDTPFGKTAYEIIAEAVEEYDYPVCYGFPAGHREDNRALILGRKVKLVVRGQVNINFKS